MPRGSTLFDVETIRDALGALEVGTHIPNEVHTYLDCYDIDFASEFAGCQHSIGWFGSGDERLCGQVITPARPRGTAIVCHGYYDHVGLYGHLLRFLLKQNLVVVTFDQIGHGLSSGARANIDTFDRYVAALEQLVSRVKESMPQPWSLYAQSMGGSVACEYVIRNPDVQFADLVLFAPLVRPLNWSFNRFIYYIAKTMVQERPRVVTKNADNEEFMALQHRDPLAPTTLPIAWVGAMVNWMRSFEARSSFPVNPKIIQGDADKTVGWRRNLKVFSRLCEPQILMIPGGRHHLVNESEEIRDAMWRWLSDR